MSAPHRSIHPPAPPPPPQQAPIPLRHRVVQFQVVDADLFALDTTGQLWIAKVRDSGMVSPWKRLPGPLDGAG